jgi:hypothetical protein
MVDWSAHYDAIYAALGVPAVLSVNTTDADEFDVTVIDKTKGVDVGDGVTVSTIAPAAAIRVSELTGYGLVRSQLDGAVIAFNGVTWRIQYSKPVPSPAGEAQGELYLILAQ